MPQLSHVGQIRAVHVGNAAHELTGLVKDDAAGRCAAVLPNVDESVRPHFGLNQPLADQRTERIRGDRSDELHVVSVRAQTGRRLRHIASDAAERQRDRSWRRRVGERKLCASRDVHGSNADDKDLGPRQRRNRRRWFGRRIKCRLMMRRCCWTRESDGDLRCDVGVVLQQRKICDVR